MCHAAGSRERFELAIWERAAQGCTIRDQTRLDYTITIYYSILYYTILYYTILYWPGGFWRTPDRDSGSRGCWRASQDMCV